MPDNSPLDERTWLLKEASEHALARKYEVSERQFRRAVQNRQIGFSRPGGRVIRFTNSDIVDFIEASFNAPLNRGDAK